MAVLRGHEIDWFRDISAPEEKSGNHGRVYVRFRLNRGDAATKVRPSSDRLIMLRNAFPESAPKLLYPNAVVVTEGAFVIADIVVRGNGEDVGYGFSIRMGTAPGPIDKEARPIADKLYAVGPASKGPDDTPTWRADSVRRYQSDPNLISFESLARLTGGNRTTDERAKLIPRSRCDIRAWPVTAYNDLEDGEAYSTGYPPPGVGGSPFGKASSAKPVPLAEIDAGAGVARAAAEQEVGRQDFRPIEIQQEKLAPAEGLGSLSVQFFVFVGDEPLPAGKQPLSVRAGLAAACPRGTPG